MSGPLILQCIGEALAEKGAKALAGLVPFGDVVFDISKDACDRYHRLKGQRDFRQDLLEASKIEGSSEARRVASLIRASLNSLSGYDPTVGDLIERMLSIIPSASRRSLRIGEATLARARNKEAPRESLEDWMALITPAIPRFRIGDRPIPSSDLELTELLGVGGFSEVWRAVHTDRPNSPSVALKFCRNREDVGALRNEMELLERVRKVGTHPGIVRLEYAHMHADPPFLEYEYVDGCDLSGLIRSWQGSAQGKDIALVESMMIELVQIIAFIHSLEPKIVHRDLKPSNILVQILSGGRVQLKVADLGIGGIAATRSLNASAPGRHSTQSVYLSTTLRGSHTPIYASPQQKKGEDPDPRDDVHALGVIWYQALTGDMSEAVGSDYALTLSSFGVKQETIDLIGSCTATNKDRRPKDAGALLAQISKSSAAEKTDKTLNRAAEEAAHVLRARVVEHPYNHDFRKEYLAARTPDIRKLDRGSLHVAKLLASALGSGFKVARIGLFGGYLSGIFGGLGFGVVGSIGVVSIGLNNEKGWQNWVWLCFILWAITNSLFCLYYVFFGDEDDLEDLVQRFNGSISNGMKKVSESFAQAYLFFVIAIIILIFTAPVWAIMIGIVGLGLVSMASTQSGGSGQSGPEAAIVILGPFGSMFLGLIAGIVFCPLVCIGAAAAADFVASLKQAAMLRSIREELGPLPKGYEPDSLVEAKKRLLGV